MGGTHRFAGPGGLPGAGEHARLRSVPAVAALSFLLLAGCGGKGDVSGRITYKGEPIPWGRVTFVCEGGDKPALSSRIRNGSYTVAGCPVGAVKISVESLPARKPISNLLPMCMMYVYRERC